MFSSVYIPDGVVSIFKGDKDKEYDELSNNMVYQVYTPLVSYSSKNTLTLEWDMEDNFSAGDCSSPVLDEYGNEKTLQWGLNLYSIINFIRERDNTPQQAYRSKMPVRYVDTYGRADLFDYIFTKHYDLSFSQIRDLPSTDISTKSASAVGCLGGSNDNACWNIRKQSTFNDGVAEFLSNDKGYIIAKDNRERLSFNYNAQLILDSDRIVLGNKLWMRDLTNSKVRIILLDVELNKFDSDIVNVENVIAATSPIAYNNILKPREIPNVSLFYYLDIENNMSSFTYEQRESCKSYAVVRADMVGAENNTNNYRIIIGKNVSDYLDLVEKFTDFEFGAYDKSSALTNRKQLDILSN
jgi:hypothetical protein